ncbi:TraX family protein [Mollicutes bacterium LVI A0078]|nr:TraX family protein [Mollicutes bacterium LVI A0075]WOO91065.1 TraX family protein [Mollicutes bacterium LVI A0078]
MTNFQLKLIALITMTIDHIGFLLVAPWSPYYEPLRTVGRLSFVLFAFLVSEGMLHTKNKERYIATMFGFAFVIDIPRLFMGYDYFPNIFYTLGIGALAIYFIKHFNNIILQIASVLALLYLTTAIGADYGAFGVMLIVTIDVSRTITSNVRVLREIVMAIFYYFLMIVFMEPDIQMFGIYSFIIIMLYNGKRGYYAPRLKYLIYIYYPLHLLILSAMSPFV